MEFLKKLGWVKAKPIPCSGKMVIKPTMSAMYQDTDGTSCDVLYDILYKRDYVWAQNQYTIILPGLTEWCERYRKAVDPTNGSVNQDFDWREWHRDGLLFTREIYRRLPRHIPLRYATPEGDTSGLIQDFDVTQEQIDDLLATLEESQVEKESVFVDSIVVGVKTEDGELCIRFKIKGKYDSFTFCLEYDNVENLKDYLERLVTVEDEPVVWESNRSQNGMCFYPQTIGGLKDMGQFHIHLDGNTNPEFAAYINKRNLIKSLYRSVYSNISGVKDDYVYKRIQSNMLDWYVDDNKYEQFSTLRKNPGLAKWINPAVMKMKDFLSEFYNSIYEDEI